MDMLIYKRVKQEMWDGFVHQCSLHYNPLDIHTSSRIHEIHEPNVPKISLWILITEDLLVFLDFSILLFLCFRGVVFIPKTFKTLIVSDAKKNEENIIRTWTWSWCLRESKLKTKVFPDRQVRGKAEQAEHGDTGALRRSSLPIRGSTQRKLH